MLDHKDHKTLIIHLGGTLGMIKHETYYRTEPHALESLIDQAFNKGSKREPYYESTKRIYYNFYETPVIIDSSNVNVDDWINLVEIVEKMYHTYDSFIVIHGTDTMAYTASALSFLIENISKPVIFTGSMVPFSEPGSDAYANLTGAIERVCDVAADVYIYFNNVLHRANCVTKVDSENFNAYVSTGGKSSISNTNSISNTSNTNSISSTNSIYNNINTISNSTNSISDCITRFYKKASKRIAIVKIFPGMEADLLNYFISNFDGLVIESYGAGNIPINLIEVLGGRRDIVILNVSQCVHGRASCIYESGDVLNKQGVVVQGENMTTEAAFTKLSFLLGNFSKECVLDLIRKNLRCEY